MDLETRVRRLERWNRALVVVLGSIVAAAALGAAFKTRKNIDGSETLVARSIEAKSLIVQSMEFQDENEKTRGFLLTNDKGISFWFVDDDGETRFSVSCKKDGPSDLLLKTSSGSMILSTQKAGSTITILDSDHNAAVCMLCRSGDKHGRIDIKEKGKTVWSAP